MKCNLAHERKLRARGFVWIAGIDEAGRGPLAGPVVAAAVMLPAKFRHKTLNDSKQLCERRREQIYEELTAHVDVLWACAVIAHGEVDRLNILRATHAAMRTAVELLARQPDHLLIDGLPVKGFAITQTALIDGDARSFSIAAASVIAKVTRDRLMHEFDTHFPNYGFSQHKGYATPLHLERLRAHGPCPIHRRTFLPVQQALLSFA